MYYFIEQQYLFTITVIHSSCYRLHDVARSIQTRLDTIITLLVVDWLFGSIVLQMLHNKVVIRMSCITVLIPELNNEVISQCLE